jgi:glycosyltransferase involved in cell wall biosynthesis
VQGQRVSQQVKFVGTLDAEGVRRLLSEALLSVVPSVCYENFPNAILERSLVAGTPVAASALGSTRAVLRGTDAGTLFGPGDVGNLADRLVCVPSQADTLNRMNRAARIHAADRYGPDRRLRGLPRVLEDGGHAVTRSKECPEQGVT